MKRFISIIILMSAIFAASALTLGEQADSAYNKEDYRRAIELYQQSIASEGRSSDIYYNLGNAYYRNDNLGKAVLNYERAIRLDPTNEDARTNLAFVRSKIQDRPEDDSAFLANVHHSLMGSFTPNAWAWTAFALFLLLAGAVALYIFSRNVALRKTGFFGGIVLLCLFAYVLLLASDSVDFAESHKCLLYPYPRPRA
ncbi:MAG: tetratricopeptide repeat protein [Muribaculaceae bacterium]|nr:tetratricopeptide repeat protein [Muribaculaceae bacterium]